MRFLDEMSASLPEGVTLDPVMQALLLWIEAEGQVYTFARAGGGRFASPYPGSPFVPGHPACVFKPCDPDHARLWLGHDGPEADRLAPILRSGGDGSHIAAWHAPDGRTGYVHMGSGSGSLMAGVMTWQAEDLIRLLAIGYFELCWPEDHAIPPAQQWAQMDLPFVAPKRFQDWVQSQIGPIPARAADLLPDMGEIGETGSGDPFISWLEGLGT